MDLNFKEIFAIINGYKNIVIVGHTNPDADAIGACFALASVVGGMGKNVCVLLENLPERYSFMLRSNFALNADVSTLSDYLFIALDCGDMGRFKPFTNVFAKAAATMNIDHHVTGVPFADHNYVWAAASSTCEIIYNLLTANGVTIDKNIATALYAGIVADTGSFRHQYTSPQTLVTAANLMKTGIEFSKITTTLLHTRTKSETHLLARAFFRPSKQ